MATFNERMKELRKEKNITLQELANVLNTTKSTLSRYENNLRIPNADFINLLAKYFNVTVDYLLGNSDNRTNPNPKEDTPYEKISKLVKENEIKTLAAHFDGEDITDDDVEDIKNFIEFVIQKRKKKDK
ncbi:helix-turn-helix domain-containing protein [Clostridium sp. WILCCON 0269]|uniref:Helix-turn-helix domain-containing protein n=1 Tax=Candidatus Clostridium eludens TaxID=3381663 RepID=A0ABW8SQH8_9CLOT